MPLKCIDLKKNNFVAKYKSPILKIKAFKFLLSYPYKAMRTECPPLILSVGE